MSTLKRFQEEDNGFNDYLESLIHNGCLEKDAEGITRKVLASGLDSLSDKQRYVFDRDVIAAYSVEKCSRCECDISWHEMTFAIDSRLCSSCEHSHERIMSE